MAQWQYNLLFLLPMYFGFAIVYDIVVASIAIYNKHNHLNPEPAIKPALSGIHYASDEELLLVYANATAVTEELPEF